MNEIRHYPGEVPCPDCDGDFDPETGFCGVCEPELELYHVFAVERAWPDPGVSKRWEESLVSKRHVGDKVLELLPGSAYVVVRPAP